MIFGIRSIRLVFAVLSLGAISTAQGYTCRQAYSGELQRTSEYQIYHRQTLTAEQTRIHLFLVLAKEYSLFRTETFRNLAIRELRQRYSPDQIENLATTLKPESADRAKLGEIATKIANRLLPEFNKPLEDLKIAYDYDDAELASLRRIFAEVEADAGLKSELESILVELLIANARSLQASARSMIFELMPRLSTLRDGFLRSILERAAEGRVRLALGSPLTEFNAGLAIPESARQADLAFQRVLSDPKTDASIRAVASELHELARMLQRGDRQSFKRRARAIERMLNEHANRLDLEAWAFEARFTGRDNGARSQAIVADEARLKSAQQTNQALIDYLEILVESPESL